MKRVVRQLVTLLALCLSVGGLLMGCHSGVNDPKNPALDGAVKVVCTNFAGYEFTRALLRDSAYIQNGGEDVVELTMLGKPGQDMHSFEPTAADIVTLGNADLVVCVGGSSEQWLDAALKSAGNGTVPRVTMMEVCTPIEEDHDHEHEDDCEDGSCTLIAGDEHVWLSVDNAIRITSAIADKLMELDGKNQVVWEACKTNAARELTALREDYRDMMEHAVRHTVVLADRHPFVYLFAELGIDCIAAFPGCSSETSASFETQMKLIETVESLNLPYIFRMEGSDGKVASVVAEETGAEVLTLNSLQVVSDMDTTYIRVMQANLENLKKALQ